MKLFLRSPRVKVGPLRSAHFADVSQSIAVYRAGSFSHFLKRKKADRAVLSGRFRVRDERSIEEIEIPFVPDAEAMIYFTDGPFGIGNILPFTRVLSRIKKPPKLHYEVPACGARSRPQWCRQINLVPPAA